MISDQSFSGQLGAISLAQILSKLQAEALTGSVHVTSAFGDGTIWYTAGTLLDAELEGTTGLKALDLLLAVRAGSFRVASGPVEQPRAIRATLVEILSRRPRLAEDFEHLTKSLPPLQARLAVDDGALAAERIELDAQQGRLLQLVDGKRSVADIVQASSTFATETVAQLALWTAAGLVHQAHEPSAAAQKEVSGPPEPVGPGMTLPSGSPVPSARRANPSRIPNTAGQFSRTPGGHATAAAQKRTPRPGTFSPGATQLGVPSISSNPPPRHSEPPQDDMRRTRLGVPGISSNPPPRHSQPPAGRAMTRPGFAMAPVPSTERIPKAPRPASEESQVPATPKVGNSTPARVDFTRTAVVARPNTVEPEPNPATNASTHRPTPSPQTTEHSPLSSRLTLAGYQLAGKLRSSSVGDVYAARKGDRACDLLVVSQVDQGLRITKVERQIAAGFSHEHALVAFDQGVEGKRAFLAYDTVKGVTLAALLTAEPTDKERGLITRVVCDCLSALGALHDFVGPNGSLLGASHNAVRAENVLVGADGVARIYMFGDASFGADAKPLRDIVAVGKLLWESVTGRALPPAKSGFLKPSELVEGVPTFFDSICARALGVDGPDHFTTARAAEQQLLEAAAEQNCLASRAEVAEWVAEHGGKADRPRRPVEDRPVAPPSPVPPEPAAGWKPQPSRGASGGGQLGLALLLGGGLAATGGTFLALTKPDGGLLGWALAGVGLVAAAAGGAAFATYRNRVSSKGLHGSKHAAGPDDAPQSEAYPDDEPAPISTSQVVLYDASPPWSKDTLPLRDNATELAAKLLQFHQGSCSVIGVTGPDGSRKSKATTAAHLAYKLSRLSALRVLLLEGDFLAPYINRAMDLTMPIGVSASRQMDGAGQEQDDSRVHVVGCLTNLHVLAEGVIRSPGALLSPRTQSFLARVRKTYDLVILAGPSVDQHPDYGAFERLVDGLVYVVPEGRTTDGAEARRAPNLRFSVRHNAPNLDA